MITERLQQHPKTSLATGAPTPIERLERLSRHTRGAMLSVKRDDCFGLALGGNKVRQLEYYLGAALARGADTLLITGAVQSNFVRLAAAAGCKTGLQCHIQLEERVAKSSAHYRHSGNVLLDRLLGATLHSYPEGEDEAGADRELHLLAERLRVQGRKPYIIPLSPGHPPLGALGYIDAAQEILDQCEREKHRFDEIVVASGSGNTHAGLLFGLRALGSEVAVTGVCVRRSAEAQTARIKKRCEEIAGLLQLHSPVKDDDIKLVDDYFPPGYGQLNAPTLEAMSLAGRLEALLLDPVYTAKTLACSLTRARALGPDRSVLFIHTGGTPALFAYSDDLNDWLGDNDDT